MAGTFLVPPRPLDRRVAAGDSRAMGDDELRRRLAVLVVNALELGTKKREPVLDDIFAAFGVEVPTASPGVARWGSSQAPELRESAAEVLYEAVPTAAALLNELLRRGGDFVTIVDEVYALLAQHVSTTTGTSESFRLQRDEVTKDGITLSPAFLEELRSLVRQLHRIGVGRLREDLIGEFLGWDNGELYGHWPLGESDGRRLGDEVLSLQWLPEVLAGRRLTENEAVRTALGEAREAAEALVAAANRLVTGHMVQFDQIAGLAVDEAALVLFSNDLNEWARSRLANELRRYASERMLGETAFGDYVAGLEGMRGVAVNRENEAAVVPTDTFWNGTSLSQLAGFVAMWRKGVYALRSRERFEADPVLDEAESVAAWLEAMRDSCQSATRWMTEELLEETRHLDSSVVVETVTEFLNLPLWRHRDLLYEVWVITATLRAAEQAEWKAELWGLRETNGVWVLSLRPSKVAVAELTYAGHPVVRLEVWREPERVTPHGLLTPDLSISTPGPSASDLFVLEAKDRFRMPAGLAKGGTAGRHRTDRRSALGVGLKYVRGLRPRAVWVCNHCDFDVATDPAVNHGDVWSRVHLAPRFRPKNIPDGFAASVRLALAPPADVALGQVQTPLRRAAETAQARHSLTLVVDVTASMGQFLVGGYELVRGAVRDLRQCFTEYRVLLYSDHGEGEPFLVRKLGPVENLTALLNDLAVQPPGNGGDVEEALEDAMQRCREIVDDIGPHPILVITDAPPHLPEACPYGVDFDAEVWALLDAGCSVSVADDWQRTADSSWASFESHAGFTRAPLRALLTALAVPK